MRAFPGPIRRRFACWLLAILASAGVSAAPYIDLSVDRDGNAYVVRAAVRLEADRRTAWLTVTDYERLPQFIPSVGGVRVLAVSRQGAVERLLVEHTGELRFLWFARPVHVWLDVTHEAPEKVLARAVLPSGVRGARSTLRDFEGSYTLTVIDALRTRLVYRARIEPVQPLFPLLGTLAVRQTVRAQFEAMADEIERRARNGTVARVMP